MYVEKLVYLLRQCEERIGWKNIPVPGVLSVAHIWATECSVAQIWATETNWR